MPPKEKLSRRRARCPKGFTPDVLHDRWVNRSTYLKHLRAEPSIRAIRRTIVADYVRLIHRQFGSTYGWRRIGAELLDEYEMIANRKLIKPSWPSMKSLNFRGPAPSVTGWWTSAQILTWSNGSLPLIDPTDSGHVIASSPRAGPLGNTPCGDPHSKPTFSKAIKSLESTTMCPFSRLFRRIWPLFTAST